MDQKIIRAAPKGYPFANMLAADYLFGSLQFWTEVAGIGLFSHCFVTRTLACKLTLPDSTAW